MTFSDYDGCALTIFTVNLKGGVSHATARLKPRPFSRLIAAFWVTNITNEHENMTAPNVQSNSDKTDKLIQALRNTEDWDCLGDRIADAYDHVFGKGEWDKLFEKEDK